MGTVRAAHQGASPCVVCLDLTDTGLAVHGDAEWQVAFLTALGVPVEDAILTLEMSPAQGPGRHRFHVWVCRSCAAKAKFGRPPVPVLLVLGALVPTAVQP